MTTNHPKDSFTHMLEIIKTVSLQFIIILEYIIVAFIASVTTIYLTH